MEARFPVTHDTTSGYQADTEIQVETDSGGQLEVPEQVRTS